MNLKSILLIIFLFITYLLSSKDTVTVYFDKEGKKTNDKNQIYFYRKAVQENNGLWTTIDYFTNKIVRMRGAFKTKELKSRHGHFIYYFENGKKKSEGDYVDNMLEGVWTYWHESGAKHSEGTMLKDEKTGVWLYWYENGAKETEGAFENGKGEGLWTSWHENGLKKTEGSYYNYMRIGVWKFYSENGNINFEENYEYGKLSSIIWYYQNGVKKAKGYYSEKKRNGEFKYWNMDEKVYLSGNYVNGEEQGEWIRYFADGEKMLLIYEKGILINKKLGGIFIQE